MVYYSVCTGIDYSHNYKMINIIMNNILFANEFRSNRCQTIWQKSIPSI